MHDSLAETKKALRFFFLPSHNSDLTCGTRIFKYYKVIKKGAKKMVIAAYMAVDQSDSLTIFSLHLHYHQLIQVGLVAKTK